MREVTLAGLHMTTSCLGLGCASLGSRISSGQGARALAQAHAQGVRWFDVAPAYGAGQAEVILGGFLKDRRESVQICTKVGLLPPPQNAVKQLARHMLRPVVALATPMRAAIRKSGATANRHVTLTPDLLMSSLEQSLTRLGTDHVDVYALHNADPADLVREDILRTLENLYSAGKTRALAVAGDEAAAKAAIAQGAPFAVVQLAQTHGPQAARIAGAARSAGIGTVTHTVFGVSGQLARLSAQLKREPALRAKLAEAGYEGAPDAAAAGLLMARAFACNPQGVVLASMFSARSLTRNIARAALPPDQGAEVLCEEIGM
ncbi:MAG: aldo/keto reductase [Jannaschia sp.]